MADTNTFAIMTAFLDLVEEPEARRSALSDFVLRWINYGYQKVCSDYLKPSVWEQITLDSVKAVSLSTLARAYREVRKVARYKDGSPEAGYGSSAEYPIRIVDGSLIVPAAEAGAAMWLRYYYHPPVLTMATSADDTTASTIPALILPDVRRLDLHFLAAAKYGARRAKFATKAPYWEQQFITAFEDMKPPTDNVDMKIRNKYPAGPSF